MTLVERTVPSSSYSVIHSVCEFLVDKEFAGKFQLIIGSFPSFTIRPRSISSTSSPPIHPSEVHTNDVFDGW